MGIFSSYRCSLVLSQVLFFVVFGIYRLKYQETREWWNKKMAVHTWYEEKFCSLLAFFSSLRRRKRKAHLANYIHPSRQWGEAFLSAVAYVDTFPSSAFLNFPHEQLTYRFKKGFYLDLYNFCFYLRQIICPMGQIQQVCGFFTWSWSSSSILEKINEWKTWIRKKKHLKLAGAVCKYHLLKEKGPFGESGYRSRYLPHAKRALYHLS